MRRGSPFAAAHGHVGATRLEIPREMEFLSYARIARAGDAAAEDPRTPARGEKDGMALRLDGETRLYPILGDPIGQVKSPERLSAILAQRGENALVVPMHVAAADLAATVAALKPVRNIEGMIATVPHKAAMLALCDAPSERTRYAGSVNVMRRRDDGTWAGDNTDGQGYLDGLAACGFDVAGCAALLAGAGGAGAAVAFEILARGAAELAIHDIDTPRRDALIGRLGERFPGRVRAGGTDPRGFALVADVTPLGMRAGDPLPVAAQHLTPAQTVASAVTKPEITPLLAAARERGCTTMSGQGMFDAQAVLLVDTLTGRRRID